MTDRQLGEFLNAIGHPPAGIEYRANGFFYAHCSCGYLSARRQTEPQAVEALLHHMRKVGREMLANGVSPGQIASGR